MNQPSTPIQTLAAIAPPPSIPSSNKVADLLPWNWKANLEPKAAVAARAILSGRSRLPGVLAGCIPSARIEPHCRFRRHTGWNPGIDRDVDGSRVTSLFEKTTWPRCSFLRV